MSVKDVMSPFTKPTISVIMPLYNMGAEVGRAVSSVLLQTVSNIELIVVNDGSTDFGPEAVKSVKDARIRIIDQENAGVSAARNRGINEAESGLLAFLDADDEWKPGFLETVLSLRNRFPHCSVFATSYDYCDAKRRQFTPIFRGIPAHPWSGVFTDYFKAAARSDPILRTSALAVRKEALHAVGLFPVGVTSGEDLLTWVRLALRFGIAYSTESKVLYYVETRLTGRPIRIPDKEDTVGKSLLSFLSEVPLDSQKWLKAYIGLWHRMRASTFIGVGMHQEAYAEVLKMSQFAGRNLRFYFYTAMLCLPKWASAAVNNGVYFVRPFRRLFYKN